MTRAQPQQQLVVFNHIHKTAGSTLHKVLWRAYPRGSVAFAMTRGTYAERLRGLSESLDEGDDVRALVTHGGFGVDAVLPAHVVCRYFTLLRDPVERTLSSYGSLRRKDRLPPGMTLAEFLADPQLSWNVQTSSLSGHTLERNLVGERPDPDAFGPAMLERAVANLDRHEVVGLVERFDESLVLLRRTFGWSLRAIAYSRRNVAPARDHPAELDAATRSALMNANRLDMELFELVAHRFGQAIAQVPDVARQLQTLTRANRLRSRSDGLLEAPFVRAARRRLTGGKTA